MNKPLFTDWNHYNSVYETKRNIMSITAGHNVKYLYLGIDMSYMPLLVHIYIQTTKNDPSRSAVYPHTSLKFHVCTRSSCKCCITVSSG